MKKIKNKRGEVMKRYLIIALCLFCVVLLTSSIEVNASNVNDEFDTPFTDQYLEKVDNSSKKNKVLLKAIEKQDKVNNRRIYDEGYSGSFIDEEGNLNIGYTDSQAAEEYSAILSSEIDIKSVNESKVIFCQQAYSYNELKEIHDFLIDYLSELNITQIGIKQSENLLHIYIVENADRAKIITFTREHIPTFTPNKVKFIVEEKLQYTANVYAFPGTETYYRYGLWNLNKQSMTVAYNAKDLVSNRYGIVTASHSATEGYMMKNENGEDIGTVNKRVSSESLDAVFIPFESTSKITWIPSYQVKYKVNSTTYYASMTLVAQESDIIEGVPICKVGYRSGLVTGCIIYASCTAQVENKLFTNLIKYSGYTITGDSGGPVWIPSSYAYTNKLMALNIGATVDNAYGVGCRIYLVNQTLNIQPVLSTTY